MYGEGFLLGFSTGTYCIMTCAPLAIPFLFSENIEHGRQNFKYVGLMLLGRFISYIITGALIGFLGGYALSYLDPALQRNFSAVAYTFAGFLLLMTGLMYNFPTLKLCEKYKKFYRPGLSAFLFGILSGLNLCPPFFAAASRVFSAGSSISGILYFAMFYLGTSVYFLPLFGIHLFKKYLDTFRMISRITMILLGIYFIFVHGFLTLV